METEQDYNVTFVCEYMTVTVRLNAVDGGEDHISDMAATQITDYYDISIYDLAQDVIVEAAQ